MYRREICFSLVVIVLLLSYMPQMVNSNVILSVQPETGWLKEEQYEKLLPDKPVIDMVAMTPKWPTYVAGPNDLNFDNLAPDGVATDGKYLFIADSNNYRVLVYDLENITNNKGLKPKIVLGQPDFYTRIPSKKRNGLTSPTGIATDGKYLFIADGVNGRILIYNHIPTKNYEEPDLVIGDPYFAEVDIDFPLGEIGDIAWDGKWLYVVKHDTVVVFKKIPLSKDEKFEIKREDYIVLGEEGVSKCSRTTFCGPVGIDVDDKYVYVSEVFANRVLIWKKENLRDHAPADFVIGYKDFECKEQVEDPRGRIYGNRVYDVASNSKYLFITDDFGRVLVFEKDKFENGMLAKYVIGRRSFEETYAKQVPSKDALAVPRGIEATDDWLIVLDKGFYSSAVLIYNLSKLENGLSADYIIGGAVWPRNPKYGLEIVDNKMFVCGQEYVAVFNELPRENYQYADWYLGGPMGGGLGGVDVSSDGKHLCVIEKGGTIGIYNEIPDEPREPDITIKEIGKYGVIFGGAASGISCKDGKLAAVSSDRYHSMVLVWKSMPTRDNQEPDVVLTKAAGEPIIEPFHVFIYKDMLFVAQHINSRVLVYFNISKLTNDSEPDLIIKPKEPMLRGPHYVFYDGKYLFITDLYGIFIYHGLPKYGEQPPDEYLEFVSLYYYDNFQLHPWGIKFDGKYIWTMVGCDIHYSFLARIPTRFVEPAPKPEKLVREGFIEYVEGGEVPEFLRPFEPWIAEAKGAPKELPKKLPLIELEKVPSVERSYGEAVKGRFGGGGLESIDFKAMAELGVTWKRAGFDILNPDFKPMDNQVMACQKAGIILHVIIDLPFPEIPPDEFARRVKEVVERYDGDGVNDMSELKFPVRHYEIMNEIHSRPEWSLETYKEYYVKAYEAIKEACSECKVSPSSFIGPDREYLSFLKENSLKFDFLSYHSYVDYLEVDRLMEILQELGLKNIEIWVTESQFGGMEKKLERSEEEVAEALVKSYVYALAKGIAKVSPSELKAKEYFPEGLKHSCLIDVDGRRKPAFYAYKTLIKMIDGFNEARIISKNPFLAEFKFKNKVIYVAWGKGKLPLEGRAYLVDMYGKEIGEVDLSEYELKDELVYIELAKPAPETTTTPAVTEKILKISTETLAILLLSVALIGIIIYVIKRK